MITKTFICDLCKKSVGEKELTTITIQGKVLKRTDNYTTTQNISKDVCVHCLQAKGMLIESEPKQYDEKFNQNQKTIETKFIEILEDLGVAFQE